MFKIFIARILIISDVIHNYIFITINPTLSTIPFFNCFFIYHVEKVIKSPNLPVGKINITLSSLKLDRTRSSTLTLITSKINNN